MQQRVKHKSSSVITLVLVTLVVLVCLALAYWQWQRAIDKQMLTHQLDKQLKLNSVQMLELPAEQNNGLSSVITGHFVRPFIWFLDNQVLDGQVGFDVLALLRLNSKTDKTVLVNLGFVAAEQGRKTPVVELPSHEVTLDILIKSQDLVGFTLASEPSMNSEQPQLLQYIDLEFLSEFSQEVMYPLVTYQQGVQPIVAKPHYQHVVMSADKHKAYALQWLLIAFAAVVIAYVAIKKGKQS
ncbi:SURF1 family protein [Pseudoalteromonas sp. S16_S37]|uniref:SURF1 family protein n=1 Tax=Pseudoalteromonas sp. S16_S37 TaxID=2720228 RepID=UPI0016808552|nr:SURF1 family protein [Pseudoalteromonas sp. S16_S37]MBD1582024.1 SURF1 family protein [Pseudoalteromonas sp. S16_S37]